MKRTLIGAAIAAAIFAGAAAAQGMMGHGMGHGQGQGMGMGQGMMDECPGMGMGPGMGQGAMGGSRGGLAALELSDDQRKKIGDIQQAMHKQMSETRLQAQERIHAVLTPEQRKQLGR